MIKIIYILISLPKTIFFNFKYLPFRQAVKLPVFLSFDTYLKIDGGGVILSDIQAIKTALIRIGFHALGAKHPENTRLLIDGKLFFLGSAHIGKGSIIRVVKNATLELGDNFAISGCSTINCNHHITIGKDVQLAWDDLIMDSDTHTIYDEQGKRINEDKDIIIGDKVWVGCRATILKGTVIPNNCVVGACSLISGHQFETSTIIAGSPAKSIKHIGGFQI